jgi:hypothetical protein
LALVIDGADVRVIESGCGFGLALEALQRMSVLCQVFGKKLQGYAPIEPDVFGLIDYAHPSAAELFHNTVMGDGLPYE